MNTATHLLEIGRPEDVAVIDAQARYTYADLSRAVGQVARGLEALGLPSGSSVGIVGQNSFFWVAGYLGTLAAGFVAVPFPAMLSSDEVARNARIAHCRAAVMDAAAESLFADAFDAIVTDCVLQPEGSSWRAAPAALDSDATYMFTSGTTAVPRAVRLTHRNIQANTCSIVEYLGITRSDRMLVVLPFSYVFGASLLHSHLRAGASLAICNSFTYPETALDMLAQEECTGIAGVPSTFQMLLRRSTFRCRALPSLRTIQQAGGKLAPAHIEELRQAQPQARVFVMYGATEATARLSYLPPEDLATRLGSVGRGIPGVELQVLDDDGNPVAPGQVGEIFARGANISPGYLDDPTATADKFPGGRLRTGDLATVDEDGFIYIQDRKDDFIKSWGHRVSSQGIEAAVLTCAGLVSVAATGVPDPEAGEAIWLFATVDPAARVTSAKIAGHCRRVLARPLRPRRVLIVDELPMNSAGKVAKARLRELARAQAQAEQGASGVR